MVYERQRDPNYERRNLENRIVNETVIYKLERTSLNQLLKGFPSTNFLMEHPEPKSEEVSKAKLKDI